MKPLSKYLKLLVLLFFLNVIKGSGQAHGGKDSTLELHFADGFNNTLVEIKDASKDTIIFKKILTSNKVLGFARSVRLIKALNYFIIVGQEKCFVNADSTKFVYVNLIDSKLQIRYSNKKKLYE